MMQDVVKQMGALVTAGFALASALAWNTAIEETFRVVLGEQSGLWALISYAVVVTIVAVFATIWIGKAAAKAGGKDESDDTSTKRDSQAA